MNNTELIFIDGEEKPKLMYTPYVYAIINEYSACYTVKKGDKITVVNKKREENKHGNSKKM